MATSAELVQWSAVALVLLHVCPPVPWPSQHADRPGGDGGVMEGTLGAAAEDTHIYIMMMMVVVVGPWHANGDSDGSSSNNSMTSVCARHRHQKETGAEGEAVARRT